MATDDSAIPEPCAHLRLLGWGAGGDGVGHARRGRRNPKPRTSATPTRAYPGSNGTTEGAKLDKEARGERG
eukprot:scaffold26_cov173-Pinguiococcus_pyrenoidosus.AAC.1